MERHLHVPDDLRERFTGDLVEPGDPAYDDLRRVHNGMIDRHPLLVARCAHTADVVDAVGVGRRSGADVAVRGGGHNVAGRATTDGVLVDLGAMRGVTVDARRQLIHAGPGATWRDLDRAAHLYGLATTGGTISTTGVAGLTLGGGLGYLMGGYGLAADNLVEAEVVTADGDVLVAGSDEGADPDLLWALRGGGGNFGVVTRLTFRGHALREVTGGITAYTLDGAPEAIGTFRSVCEAAPDDLGAVCGLVHAPDGSGTKIVALPMCHAGDPGQAAADLAPLRSVGRPVLDAVQVMSYPVVNTLLDGGFPKGALNYWKSTFLTSLPDEAVETLLGAYRDVPSPMSCIVIEHLHGAVTRVPVDATAYPHRARGFNVLVLGQWASPTDTSANIAWTRETFEALRPWAGDGAYVNYLSADDDAKALAAYGPNHARLVKLKRRFDPTNLFHLNQNIDPAAA